MDADPGLYGRSFADVYDDWYADVSDVEGTVARVVDLAAGGVVLELGSGTGRLAGPLTEAGADVIGLDASPEMNRRFATKGAAIAPIEADMASLPVREGAVAVVLVAYNTICNLAAPGAQARCVAESARVLGPDGSLVVEVLVPPDPELTPTDTTTSVRSHDDGVVVLTSTSPGDDPDHIRGRHIEIQADGTRRERPWELRWITPAALDEMAARAGLELVDRHADWRRRAFDQTSDGHVSVYRRPVSR